jgi:hypothetical protein
MSNKRRRSSSEGYLWQLCTGCLELYPKCHTLTHESRKSSNIMHIEREEFKEYTGYREGLVSPLKRLVFGCELVG